MPQVKVTDVALRDAHQSLLATRMRTEDMLPICEQLDRVGYWSLEAWGGATFDSCLRFLHEDPWERLSTLKEALPKTRLQMLLRGQNILGYRHYADDTVERFVGRAYENGNEVFRIFDAFNDPRNLKTAMRAANSVGGWNEPCICYTTSPVHSTAAFVELGRELVAMEADSLCIKDMAGLLLPHAGFELVQQLREALDVPIHIHSHYTSGAATATLLKCIEAGAEIIDTAISSMSMGTSHPPTETLVASLRDTEWDTGLDLELLGKISDYFKRARTNYAEFESPFTGVDSNVLTWQVPGGMMSNLSNQLREAGMLDKMDEMLAEVPRVRKDLGYPPLVTPSSQIVGTQAVLNVVTGGRYKMPSAETTMVLAGRYGATAAPVDPKIQKRVLGDEKAITCRPADLLEPEFDTRKAELRAWWKTQPDAPPKLTDEDVLSFALFPQVAKDFFTHRAGHAPPAHTDPLPPADALAFGMRLGDAEYDVQLDPASLMACEPDGSVTLWLDGKHYEVAVANLPAFGSAPGHRLPRVAVPGGAPALTPAAAPTAQRTAKPAAAQHTGAGVVRSPMPAKVISFVVAVGDSVAAEDVVATVEAMKMESDLNAPIAGVVREIPATIGQMVTPNDALVVIEAE